MEPITEKEEERIDKSSKYYGEIRHVRSDGYIIPSKDIYLYGEVDLDNDEDINNIEKFNLIDSKSSACNWIYSNFDFENGCFTTIDGIAKGYPIWDAFTWFLFNYVLLGKPKRIIIYNYPIDKRKYGG